MNRIPHLELPQFESSQIPERARERVETGAMMELELDIQYEADGVTCRDSRVIRKSNLWRDFFPGAMDGLILGQATLSHASGVSIPEASWRVSVGCFRKTGGPCGSRVCGRGVSMPTAVIPWRRCPFGSGFFALA